MNRESEHAISPVVGVILMVAVTVILSAVVGTFVFTIGGGLDKNSGQQVGVQATTDGTNVTYRVVTGTADKVELRVNGTVVDSISDAQPGDTLSATVNADSKISVIAVTNGESTLASTTNPLSNSGSVEPLSNPSPTAPTNGLVSHWKFDEGTGSTAFDSNGSHDASLTKTTWVSGRVGSYALSFPQSDSNGLVGDYSALEGSGGHTISAWVKTSTIEHQDIFSKWDQSNNDRNYLLMLVNISGSLHARGHVASGTGFNAIVDSSIPVETGQWVLVTQTWDGTTLRVYLNDTEVASTSFSYSLSDTPTNVYIGDREAGTSARLTESFDGEIDDVRYYNRALNNSEMGALYNATK